MNLKKFCIVAGVLVAVLGMSYVLLVPSLFAKEGDQKDEQITIKSLKITSYGKLTDLQGLCFVKGKGTERWSPLVKGFDFLPEDTIKTDSRGANALQIRFEGGSLIAGPGSILRILKGNRVEVSQGTVEIKGDGKSVFLKRHAFKDKAFGNSEIMKFSSGRATFLKGEPHWLKYFKGTVSDESMGSLVATVDGRAVPLTIGYHKVTVDIYDQIARTTIEESFVNHTGANLEGVFYFPLPQDASISGFGMWIGGELVEADVVEKQRAREIYETILRERRDPALLEWTGGSIFKARVFPIFPHSEKRVKITYTQVLPKKGSSFKYSYALQSDMLRENPLRELGIKVNIHSSKAKITNINCPSHQTDITKTANSGSLEFHAQQYTPVRDFELDVELEGDGPALTVIPHQRGEDGYFMMMLSPEGEKVNRGLLPEGRPLDLIILADTSASMGEQQRKNQQLFITSIISSLRERRDRWQLAAVDTKCNWLPENNSELEDAISFLSKRRSLGWTDLDTALKEAFSRAGKDTDIIYIGDGVGTKGESDPAIVAQRLKRLYKGKGRVHVVANGSGLEPVVVKALASMGSGSSRSLGSSEKVPVVTSELLHELLEPGIRDLELKFSGFRAARIYPEQLPNLSFGTQQIILGRYLPEGDLSGKVSVSGVKGGEKVEYQADFKLAAGESGNSFIPRLWARKHLDMLLAQGSSKEIKEEVIQLSERFHIMTPYTSFLVLESDEDRERFGVKKRMTMRDGERYFADGRNSANWELKRKHLEEAGAWRLGIQKQKIRELLLMGRLSSSNRFPGAYRGRERAGKAAAYRRSAPAFKVKEDALYDSKRPILELASQEAEEAFLDELSEALEDSMPEQIEEEEYDFKLAKVSFETDDFSEEIIYDYDSLDYPLSPNINNVSYSRPAYWIKDFVPDTWGSQVPKFPKETRLFELIGEYLLRPKIDSIDFSWEVKKTQFSQIDSKELYADLITGAKKGEAWFWNIESSGGLDLQAWSDGKNEIIAYPFFKSGVKTKANTKTLKFLSYGLSHLLLAESGLLHLSSKPYKPSISDLNAEEKLLEISHPNGSKILIKLDPIKKVILRKDTYFQGKITDSLICSNFQKISEVWLPGKLEWIVNGKKINEAEFSFKETDKSFEKNFQEISAQENNYLVHPSVLPQLNAARKKFQEGKAHYADLLQLLNQSIAGYREKEILDYLSFIEDKYENHPLTQWLKVSILNSAGRNQEALDGIKKCVNLISKAPKKEQYGLAVLVDRSCLNTGDYNERLAILRSLKPYYLNSGIHTTEEEWANKEISTYFQLNRFDKALELQLELCKKSPENISLLTRYISNLHTYGYKDKSIKLANSLLRQKKWNESQRNQIRDSIWSLFEQSLAKEESFKFLENWLKDKPLNLIPYQAYLKFLHFEQKVQLLESKITEWLKLDDEMLTESKTSIDWVRFDAAINYLFDANQFNYYHRVDVKWRPLLVKIVERLYLHERYGFKADKIMKDYRFNTLDDCLTLKKKILATILSNFSDIKLERLKSIVHWYNRNDGEKQLKPLVEKLHQRWSSVEDVYKKHELALLKLSVLSQLNDKNAELKFRREMLAKSSKSFQIEYITNLYNHLFQHDWTLEREKEIFSLWRKFKKSDDKSNQITSLISTLDLMIDSLAKKRAEHLAPNGEDAVKMSRKEISLRKKADKQKAYKGLLESINEELQKGEDYHKSLLTLQVSYLKIKTNFGRKEVLSELLGKLETFTPFWEDSNYNLEESYQAQILSRILNPAILLSLKKDDELRKSLEEFLKAKVENDKPSIFRQYLYNFYIANDEPGKLVRYLKKWVDEKETNPKWELDFAYLLAEMDNLDQAVQVFDKKSREGSLSYDNTLKLSYWYQILDRKEESEKARLKAWSLASYSFLERLIRKQLRLCNQTSSVNQDGFIFEQLAELSRKKQNMGSNVSLVLEFYRATKDFRFLATLVQTVNGSSQQNIYSILSRMVHLSNQVNEEATVDAFLEEAKKERAKANTDLDKRSLDLLELLVVRRATSILDQPEVWRTRALKVLKRAFEHSWNDGEKVQMADFLLSLGALKGKDLIEEQVRQVKTLAESNDLDRFTRLSLKDKYVRILNYYRRYELSIPYLKNALDEYRIDGKLDSYSLSVIHHYIDLLKGKQRFRQAEGWLLREISITESIDFKRNLKNKLRRIYIAALGTKSILSLGQGKELFENCKKLFYKELADAKDSYQSNLIYDFVALYNKAAQVLIKPIGLKEFVFGVALDVFKNETTNRYSELHISLAEQLYGKEGALVALKYCIEVLKLDVIKNRDYYNSAWYKLRNHTPEYFKKVHDKGIPEDVESELMKLVKKRVIDSLYNSRWNYNNSYRIHQYGGFFWDYKKAEFRAIAEEVWRKNQNRTQVVENVANFLYLGLGFKDRCIEILIDSEKRGIISENGLSELVSYLQSEKRYKESVTYSEKLVSQHPINFAHRRLMFNAYYETKQEEKLAEALVKTETQFRKYQRWYSGYVDQLASLCLQFKYYKKCAELYDESIKYKRKLGGQWLNKGQLSYLYRSQAIAYSYLNMTDEAVEAACGAIVNWGNSYGNRQGAFSELTRVLNKAQDLDIFIQKFEAKAKEENQGNPVLRKALAMVFKDKQEWDQCRYHALESLRDQPHDKIVHEMVIESCDQLGDKEGAVKHLYSFIKSFRRDLELYKSLAMRLSDLGREEEAKRAETTLIELFNNESESHFMYAFMLQDQNDYESALFHWRRVHEIRSLEPTGLIGMIRAQLHLKKWNEAKGALKELENTKWPERFSVKNQIETFRQKILQGQK